MEMSGGYRDKSGLATWVKMCLGAFMVICVINIWSGLQQVELLNALKSGVEVSESQLEANDLRQNFLGILMLASLVVTGIFFLRWTYFANYNAQAMGADDMDFTAGSMVWWYFVPIVNFWKPYQAMDQTYRASYPGHEGDWRLIPRPWLPQLWWLMWIAAAIAGRIASVSIRKPKSFEDVLFGSKMLVAADVMYLLAGAAMWYLVARVQAMQIERHRRLEAVGVVVG